MRAWACSLRCDRRSDYKWSAHCRWMIVRSKAERDSSTLHAFIWQEKKKRKKKTIQPHWHRKEDLFVLKMYLLQESSRAVTRLTAYCALQVSSLANLIFFMQKIFFSKPSLLNPFRFLFLFLFLFILLLHLPLPIPLPLPLPRPRPGAAH